MKVGIIGCGGIAPLHIEAFKRTNNVEVVVLCDLAIDRAKIMAQKYKINKIYSDYMEMLEKENLDILDICTPTSTHKKIVCDVAKEVPAILLEKPMAKDVGECDEIIKELEKNKTKICIGHSQIFHPKIQKIKSLVNSPDFDLYSLKTSLRASFEILQKHNLIAPWTVTPQQKGIIWEVCSHHAYLQLYFLKDISEVYALGGKNKYPVYDDFSVLLRTKEDRYGLIEISWTAKEFDIVYEARDKNGRRLELQWEYDYLLEKSRYPEYSKGLVIKNMLSDEKRIINKWANFTNQFIYKRKYSPTYNLIKEYINSLENNLPSPVSAEDGRRTVKLLECIEKSLDEKKPIPF